MQRLCLPVTRFCIAFEAFMIDLTKKARHRFKLSFVGVNMPLRYKCDY